MKAHLPPLVVHTSCMTHILESRPYGKGEPWIRLMPMTYIEHTKTQTFTVLTRFPRNSSKYSIARRADHDADHRVAWGLQSAKAACRYGSSIRSHGMQFRSSQSTSIMFSRPTENLGKFKKPWSDAFSCLFFSASSAAIFAACRVFQGKGILAPAAMALARPSHAARLASPSRWPVIFQLLLSPIRYDFGHHRHFLYIGFSPGFYVSVLIQLGS